jgi:intracellular septation protein
MKLLFDFLPILLFFGTFKYAESQREWASRFASEHLGFVVSGGAVGPDEAPVLLATVVVILATLAQVVYLKLRGKKVDTMLWINLGLVTLFGGATIYLHSEAFIKWKPTVLYWVMGGGVLISQTFFGKNVPKLLIGKDLSLPDPIWQRVGLSWFLFFLAMGVLNIWVAYNFPTATWVNFKLFGGMGLMFVFMVVQGLYLSRHLKDAAQAARRDGAAKQP